MIALPLVPLDTFGERHKARLHQILHLHARPAASIGMPGEPFDHRHELPDQLCRGAAIGDTRLCAVRIRKSGMIVLHAAISMGVSVSGMAASDPMISITSIGWLAGSSPIEMTTHSGVR